MPIPSRVAALLWGLLTFTGASAAWDAARMAQAAQSLGPEGVQAAQALQPLLQKAAALDDAHRLEPVNDFFNRRVRFTSDLDHLGVADDWSSPLQTLARGRGDCEDYAIGKYFSLLAAGTPQSRLRLVYVRAQTAQGVQAHMVLAWYATPQSDPLILDNLVPDLRPASARSDLVPVFSFNGQGLWQGVAGASAGDPLARLSRWRDVSSRAHAEGF
jgi:predicted transglutaminase-like cysteine proteinase